MRTTKKSHWVNGHQVRGGTFHTLNGSFYKLGFMLAWDRSKKHVRINFFKLI